MEHIRLRPKCNLLIRHKFKLGFSDSPNCECHNHEMSKKHYLLSCVRYSAERKAMIQTASNILTVSNLNTEFLDRPDELLDLLLKGSSSLSVDNNRLIFAAVMTYT